MKLPLTILQPTDKDRKDAKRILGLTPHRAWIITGGINSFVLSDQDNISYACRTIKKSNHKARIELFVQPYNNGKRLAFFRLGKKITRAVPDGYRFEYHGKSLVFIRDSDGMDLHPEEHHLRTFDFPAMIASLEQNHKWRLEIAEHRKDDDFRMAIFNQNIGNTMVSLFDSRRAGNCIEGSLQFASYRLGVPREEILAAPWLVTIPAARLIATGSSLARNAALAAFDRETIVSI